MATLGGTLLFEEMVWKKSPALTAHWQSRKLRLTSTALVYLCPKRSKVKNEIDLEMVSSCLARGRLLEVEAYDHKRGRARVWAFKFDSPESAAVWSVTIRRLLVDIHPAAGSIAADLDVDVVGAQSDESGYDDEDILQVTDDDEEEVVVEEEEEEEVEMEKEDSNWVCSDQSCDIANGGDKLDAVTVRPGNRKKRLYGAELLKALEEEKNSQGGGGGGGGDEDADAVKQQREESWTYVSGSWVQSSQSYSGGGGGHNHASVGRCSEQKPTVEEDRNLEGVMPVSDRATTKPRREVDSTLTCAKCKSLIYSPLGEYILSSRNKAYHELCFQCFKCRKDLDPDDFVWVGDRFCHPGCVKCKTCAAAIDGQVFLQKNSMFCKEHIVSTAAKTLCVRCNKEILFDSLTDSDNNTYHPSCFQCKVCRCELSSYYKVGEDLLCPQHYAEQHASTCSRCSKKIIDEDVVCVSGHGKFQDLKFHRRCFSCVACRGDLNEAFFVDDSSLLCERCYEDRKLPTCAGCKLKIKGKFIKAQGASFHAECFRCRACSAPLESTFVQRDGDAFCEHCFYAQFAEKCFRCKQPIKDRHVMAFGEKFHVQCLVCTACNSQLSGKFLRAENGDPVCSKACMEDLHTRFDTLGT